MRPTMFCKYLLLSSLFFLFNSPVALPATTIKAEPQTKNICNSSNSKKAEIFQIELKWNVLNEIFYNEEDFLELKQTTLLFENDNFTEFYAYDRAFFWGDYIHPLNSFYYDPNKPLHPDLGKYLDELNTRSSITRKKLIRASLNNSEWTEAGHYLSLNPRILMSEFDIDYGFPVVFKKNVTGLEACQILNTLLLEIEVSYAVYEPDPADKSKKIKIEKKDIIYLSAKSEKGTASARHYF